MENSPGEDGSSYGLVFTPDVPDVATPLKAFEVPFHFYNGIVDKTSVSGPAAGACELRGRQILDLLIQL